MEDLEQQNKQLKEFLAEALEIADFTITHHGIFIKQQYSRLKANIEKANVLAQHKHKNHVRE